MYIYFNLLQYFFKKKLEYLLEDITFKNYQTCKNFDK